jgi:hypothetical protein
MDLHDVLEKQVSIDKKKNNDRLNTIISQIYKNIVILITTNNIEIRDNSAIAYITLSESIDIKENDYVFITRALTQSFEVQRIEIIDVIIRKIKVSVKSFIPFIYKNVIKYEIYVEFSTKSKKQN